MSSMNIAQSQLVQIDKFTWFNIKYLCPIGIQLFVLICYGPLYIFERPFKKQSYIFEWWKVSWRIWLICNQSPRIKYLSLNLPLYLVSLTMYTCPGFSFQPPPPGVGFMGGLFYFQNKFRIIYLSDRRQDYDTEATNHDQQN